MNLDVKADKEYIAQSRETLRSGRGSGLAAQVSQETKEAFDYANKTFNLFE